MLLAATAAFGQESAYTPLFDGETLGGWTVENSDGSNFVVDGGVLRVNGPGGWLRSRDRYRNFDLRVEVRFLTDDADSGIFLRVAGDGETFARGWPAGSYQVQTREIAANRSTRPLLLADVYRHGMPQGRTEHDASAMFDAVRPTGDWQELRIQVNADSVVVLLNGTPVTQAYEVADRAGYVGLQGETDTVEYRAVEIRER